jgi:hypothetical protein
MLPETSPGFTAENMCASVTNTLCPSVPAAVIGGWIAVAAGATRARTNVITDWRELRR